MARVAGFLLATCCIAGGLLDGAHATAHVAVTMGGMSDEEEGDNHAVVIEFGLVAARAGNGLSRVLALAPLIDEAARRTEIDRALLMAVIDVESGGNPQAVSLKGAKGLMQLMPQTALQQGAADPFDPWQNISAGARLLRALLATYGDLHVALAAYNAGEGAVRKYGNAIPPYAETERYVQRVLERLAQYRLEVRRPDAAHRSRP